MRACPSSFAKLGPFWADRLSVNVRVFQSDLSIHCCLHQNPPYSLLCQERRRVASWLKKMKAGRKRWKKRTSRLPLPTLDPTLPIDPTESQLVTVEVLAQYVFPASLVVLCVCVCAAARSIHNTILKITPGGRWRWVWGAKLSERGEIVSQLLFEWWKGHHPPPPLSEWVDFATLSAAGAIYE